MFIFKQKRDERKAIHQSTGDFALSRVVPLLTETAKEYDGLELTISVGDLAKGLELAQKGFHANFDVIISRAARPDC